MITIGGRTILAISCRCGTLLQGGQLLYSRKNKRDPRPYADRRCIKCRWGIWAKGARW